VSPALSNAQRQRNFRERRALRRDPDVAVTSLVRAAIATGLAKVDTTIRPLEFARRQWDDRRVELVLRAVAHDRYSVCDMSTCSDRPTHFQPQANGAIDA
jgi:hypothetical protein